MQILFKMQAEMNTSTTAIMHDNQIKAIAILYGQYSSIIIEPQSRKSSQTGSVVRLQHYCGLPWNTACNMPFYYSNHIIITEWVIPSLCDCTVLHHTVRNVQIDFFFLRKYL